jgi:p-aminobenzoyl-glutamate transporter AbgT
MASKFRDYLHTIFFMIFIVVNLMIFFYLKFKVQNECDCANDKVLGLVQPLDYIVWFSLAAAGLGVINIFINFNRGFSSIPLVGTVFNFAIAIACMIQVGLLSKFLSRIDNQQCKEINKCQDSTLKVVGGIISAAGYFIYLGAFVLAILLVWL